MMKCKARVPSGNITHLGRYLGIIPKDPGMTPDPKAHYQGCLSGPGLE